MATVMHPNVFLSPLPNLSSVRYVHIHIHRAVKRSETTCLLSVKWQFSNYC